MNKRNKRVLITGGLGFVGRNLFFILNQKGYKVTILDNQYRWKVEDFEKYYGVKYPCIVIDDITNEECIKKNIQNHDIVIHLAAVSQVLVANKNPDKTFQYNVFGTYLVAKYCAKYNKKLIFSSSREVYGNAKCLPVVCESELKPENIYAASKISAESLITSFGKKDSLRYNILRLSNVYGYGDKDRVIPIFIDRATKNQDLLFYGKKKLIDFVYIDDVINIFVNLIEIEHHNLVINVGSGVGVSLEKIAGIIIKELKSKSKIKVYPKRVGEVEKFVADIKKTKSIVNGWQPMVDIKLGIKKYLTSSII